MPALNLKVFISSPGDVVQERDLAIRVLERLNGEFGSEVELTAVRWENEPLAATAHFNEELIRPSETDIVIYILWSRLGTPLPREKFQRADGTQYLSGTEWEFEEAVQAWEKYGKPHLLVYRKTAEPTTTLSDEQAVRQRLDQKKALDAFFNQWFGNAEGSLTRAFHPFESADEFQDLLRTHLRELVRARLPEHLTAEGDAPVPGSWHKGSPYRGLQAFDAEHAPVFFGRARAIGKIKQALLQQAASSRAFVLVLGASGSGKSSLVRAGVLPSLTQPGGVERIDLWRWCIFRPSDAGEGEDLFDGLAQALLGKQALPELEENGFSAGELAALLREAPRRVLAPLGAVLKHVAAAEAKRHGLQQPPETRLLVVVDQMEEIFTREGVDERQREGFLAVLSELARSGLGWVIATMRSDFYPRCTEMRELASLKEGSGSYDLLPPNPAEIRQMICYPAIAAGLRFERSPESKEGLDEVLHEAAIRNPEALPLLEFTLDELFKQSEDGVLTFAAYDRLGGLEGALTHRAEEVLTSQPPSVQEALPSLLRALVTVGQGEGSVPSARRVLLARLISSPSCETLVQMFIRARLLVTDRAKDGQAVVGVAHEALLRHWPRVQKWLEKDLEFLRVRARVAADELTWREQGRRADYLLQPGKPLTDALELLSQRPAELEPELVEYIQESARKATRRRWGLLAAGALVGVVLLAATVVTSIQKAQLGRQTRATVEAIANLADVPQNLQEVDDAVSARILKDIADANDRSLTLSPDAPMRRAKAVNCLLRAEMYRRTGQLTNADRCFQDLRRDGTRLARQGNNAIDQHNLAAFYFFGGRVQEALAAASHQEGRREERDRHWNEALKLYLESRRLAELAIKRKDPTAQSILWSSYYGSATVLGHLGNIDEALADSRVCLQLAVSQAKLRNDDPVQSDLAASHNVMGDLLDAQGSSYAYINDTRAALRSWSEARAEYKVSRAIYERLARSDYNVQAKRNLKEVTRRLSEVEIRGAERSADTASRGGHDKGSRAE